MPPRILSRHSFLSARTSLLQQDPWVHDRNEQSMIGPKESHSLSDSRKSLHFSLLLWSLGLFIHSSFTGNIGSPRRIRPSFQISQRAQFLRDYHFLVTLSNQLQSVLLVLFSYSSRQQCVFLSYYLINISHALFDPGAAQAPIPHSSQSLAIGTIAKYII